MSKNQKFNSLPPLKDLLNSNLIFSNENNPLAKQEELINNIRSLPIINVIIRELLLFSDFVKEEKAENPIFTNFPTETQRLIINLLDKLQDFCNEKFIFLRFIQSFIDDEIKELMEQEPLYNDDKDEEAFHAKIKEFADKIDKNKLYELTGGSNKQIGGMKGLKSLLMSILILFFFYNSGSGYFSNLNDNRIILDEKGQLIPIDPTINNALISRPPQVVVTPNVNPLVQKYDEKQLVNMDSLKNLALVQFNTIFALVAGPENDGNELLQEVIDGFNTKAAEFSEESTKECKNIMHLIFEKKIFLLLKNLEEVKARNEAIENIRKEVIEDLKKFEESKSKNPTYSDYYDYFFKVKEDTNAKANAIVAKRVDELVTIELPESEKHKMNMLYTDAAKAMCRPALNFQLILQPDKTITIEGGKVNEYEIRALLSLLQENIKSEINTLMLTLEDKAKPTPELLALNSLEQRLSVLDKLIHELHTMTQLTIYEKIEEILRNPRGDSIETLKGFLNKELVNLNEILKNLKRQFPVAHERIIQLEKMVEQQQEIVKQEGEILKKEAEIKADEIIAEAAAINKINDAKNEVFNEQIGKKMGFAGEVLAKVAEGAVGIAGKPIVAMSTELFSTFSKLIFTMLGSTGGWAAMGVLGIVLYIQGMTVFGFAYRLTKNIIVFVVKSSKGIIIYAFKIIGKSFIFLGSFFKKKPTNVNEQPNNDEKDIAEIMAMLDNKNTNNLNYNQFDLPEDYVNEGTKQLLNLSGVTPTGSTSNPPTGGKKQTKKGRRSKNKKNKSRKHHKKSKKQKKH